MHKHDTRRACAAVAAAVMLAAVTAAQAQDPGGAGDPIALKSYVDAQIGALEDRIATGAVAQAGGGMGGASGVSDTQINALAAKVAQLQTENESLRQAVAALSAGGALPAEGTAAPSLSSASAGGAQFEVHQVQAGQRVLLGAGAELVVRTGKAEAIRGELGGVVDLISGKELAAGADVATNHLLISSRDDGRGVRFTADAYALLKGAFSIRD
jgi:hypothetical protein